MKQKMDLNKAVSMLITGVKKFWIAGSENWNSTRQHTVDILSAA